MIKPILLYPNPILRQVSTPVVFPDPGIKEIAINLVETLRNSKGLGLSAPQIGILKRIVAVYSRESTSSAPLPLILVNPRLKQALNASNAKEACLSFPGLVVNVLRHNEVHVLYQDLEGNEREAIALGVEAQCIVHEIEHLDGKLLIDKLSPARKLLAMKGLNKK